MPLLTYVNQREKSPVHSEERLRFENELYIQQLSWVGDYIPNALRVFEVWDFEKHTWMDKQFYSTTPIAVPRGTPSVFIRTIMIHCPQFGLSLSNVETTLGIGLGENSSVGDLVCQYVAARQAAVFFWNVRHGTTAMTLSDGLTGGATRAPDIPSG